MTRLLTVVMILAACPSAFAAAPPAVPRDLQGDPLPPGARARMGTMRFRPAHRLVDCKLLLSPDGKVLASVGHDTIGSLWDCETGRLVARFPIRKNPELCFSPDGGKLFVAYPDRKMATYDCSTGRLLGTRKLGKSQVPQECRVVFSADRKRVGLVTSEGKRYDAPTIEICDLPDGDRISEVALGKGEHLKAIGSAGKWLVTSEGREPLRLRDGTGKLLHDLDGTWGEHSHVTCSPDGGVLLVIRHGHPWSLWDVKKGKQLLKGEEVLKDVQTVGFSANGKTFVLAWTDAVRTFDARTGQLVRSRTLPFPRLACLALSGDGNRVAHASGTRAFQVTDLRSGKAVPLAEGHHGTLAGLAFSPDGKRLSTLDDETLRLWDVGTGEQDRWWKHSDPYCRLLGFSQDGKRIFTADTSPLIAWDVRNGKSTKTQIKEKGWVARILSPGGKWLVVLSREDFSLVETASGKTHARIDPGKSDQGGYFTLLGMAFSSDPDQVLLNCRFRTNSEGVIDSAQQLLIVDLRREKVTRKFAPSRDTARIY